MIPIWTNLWAKEKCENSKTLHTEDSLASRATKHFPQEGKNPYHKNSKPINKTASPKNNLQV